MRYSLDYVVEINSEVAYESIDGCITIFWQDHIYCLNDSGSVIWSLCDGKAIGQAIFDFMDMLEKPFSSQEVFSDCMEMISNWIDIGLLDIVSENESGD